MTRVIDNLLQNAAKFTAAGSVTVCCDKDDRTRKLRIRVTDTGIGIAPDKQEWVFDRFTKVDSFKPGSHRPVPLPPDRHPARGCNPRMPRLPRGLLHRNHAPVLTSGMESAQKRADFSSRDSPRIAIRT